MTLADALSGPRAANLDALRLLLAAAVIVSHAWPLALGPGAPEPLSLATGHSLGGWAVLLFFFLSGLLVSGSAERRSLRAFWAARARRLLPGLGAALLVTLALALASGASPSAPEASLWFARALTLVSIEHRLPGAFAGNPYPEVVNGPLWSLFHEVAAYALCLLLVRAGVLRHRGALAGLVAVAAALAVGHGHLPGHLPGRLATFAPLFAAFAAGMAVHALRARLPVTLPAALACLAAAVLLPAPLAAAALGCAALVLALRAPALPLGADVSYGLYIYGWPVAQMIVHLRPGLAPAELAVLGLATTLPFAVASWHLVERPALRPARATA
jgi:peptidoglycan/LPS O-acetylase OafA/YrhL